VTFARKSYGLTFTVEQAKELKELWCQMDPVFRKHLKPPTDPDNPGYYIGRTTTGRIRRRSEYCAACNYPFGSSGADVKQGEFRGRHGRGLSLAGNPEPSRPGDRAERCNDYGTSPSRTVIPARAPWPSECAQACTSLAA